MKLLYLTVLNAVPTEEGQKRIEKAVKKNKSSENDEYKQGSKAWYESLGVAVPKDLEEEDSEVDEISEDGYMNLPLDEIDYEFSDLIVALEDFSTCEDNPIIGSHLYTKSGEIFHIEETCEQLFGYIAVITRPWHQRIIDWIKIKLSRNGETV